VIPWDDGVGFLGAKWVKKSYGKLWQWNSSHLKSGAKKKQEPHSTKKLPDVYPHEKQRFYPPHCHWLWAKPSGRLGRKITGDVVVMTLSSSSTIVVFRWELRVVDFRIKSGQIRGFPAGIYSRNRSKKTQ
jgi:hypothetical protein